MKRILPIMLLIITAFQGFSQTRGISYQAVILSPQAQEIPGVNAQGNILANSAVSIQFTIVNASGSEEFQEYHTTRTDMYGMINLLIGNGIVTSYNSFNDIVWDGTTKKLKVEIDFSGGTNFSPLSEQNLSYMPQPVSNETAQIINENATKIVEENTRAEAAEQANLDAINLKEDAANKSTDGTLATNSDVLFPTEKAVKTYVDAQSTSGSTELDAEIVRATAAEVVLTTNLGTEVTRATTAEDVIQADVEANQTASEGADVILTSNLATEITNRINADLLKAPLASPTLTGTPTLPTGTIGVTQTAGDNTTALATTAFVTAANTTNANLTGPITSSGNATSVASQTGTGSTFVMDTSPTLVMPVLGVATATSINETSIPTSKTLVVTTDKLSVLSATTSAELAGVISDETGTGNVVLSASPTLTGTPTLPTGTIGVTQTAGDNTTALATTAFVKAAVVTSIDGLSDGKTDASNLFLGQDAGLKDDGDNNNTGVGNGALSENTSGIVNAAFGKKTLASNTTGSNNTGFGGYALNKNTTGLYNTAIGSNALLENTTGNNNVALGYQSLRVNTIGNDNTALGYRPLYFNTTGIFNTATGGGALFQNIDGDHNTATGYKALELNTTGNDNTAIGYFAGSSITTGSNNTAIGKDAQIADPTADNQIQLGNTAITSVKTSGKLTTGAVTYPNTDGTASQFLTTDGSGYLSWATAGLTNFTESNYIYDTKTGVKLLATNAATNVDVVLNPKGSGALLAQQPDGAVAGGNNRGIYAVDFQMKRLLSTQVASGNYAVIVGGFYNTASGYNSSMVGGYDNTSSGQYSSVVGGYGNTASGELSYVGGGLANNSSGQYSSVVGGYANNSSGQYSSVVGGSENTASREYSFVGGGQSNTARGIFSFVGGGKSNTASSSYSSVVGGNQNSASGDYSSVVGGSGNTAQSYGETVLGLHVTVGTGTANYYVATDRLFVIGNGLGDTSRSNALTILKNANTTIGGSLTVNGNGSNTSFALPAARGTSGQVLTTDGAGVTSWASAAGATALAIGQSYQGGVIFWLDATGQHGLIVATANQSTGITWSNGTYKFTGSEGDGLYAGAMNTAMIVAQQMADSPTGNFAAKVCADYSVTVDGVTFGDWYLPSNYELTLLNNQTTVVSGFDAGYYWSSTESTDSGLRNDLAWSPYLPGGYQGTSVKGSALRVRAIRAF